VLTLLPLILASSLLMGLTPSQQPRLLDCQEQSIVTDGCNRTVAMASADFLTLSSCSSGDDEQFRLRTLNGPDLHLDLPVMSAASQFCGQSADPWPTQQQRWGNPLTLNLYSGCSHLAAATAMTCGTYHLAEAATNLPEETSPAADSLVGSSHHMVSLNLAPRCSAANSSLFEETSPAADSSCGQLTSCGVPQPGTTPLQQQTAACFKTSPAADSHSWAAHHHSVCLLQPGAHALQQQTAAC